MNNQLDIILDKVGCAKKNLTCLEILKQMVSRSNSEDLDLIEISLDQLIQQAREQKNVFNKSQAVDESYDSYYYVTLWTIVVPIIFAFIILIGIIGNSLVIYVVLTTPKLRTSTNNYLLNLAISDITVLTICVPFQAYKYAAWSWDMGDVWCKIIQYLLYVTIYVTIWTLVSIAGIRYVILVHTSSRLNKYVLENRSIHICIGLWVVILLVNIPTLLTHQVNKVENYTYCGVVKGDSTKYMFISFFICAYVLPLCLICLFYLMVIHHLHINSTNTYVCKKNYTFRVSKLVIIVVMVFSACWLPFHVHSLVSLYGNIPKGKWYEVFRIVWHCLIYGNSLVNPLIYNFASNDFRQGFKSALSCVKFRKKRFYSEATNIRLSASKESKEVDL